jgi:hypothetical protein
MSPAASSRSPFHISTPAVLISFFLTAAVECLALAVGQLLNPPVVSFINWIIKRGRYDMLYLHAEEFWLIAISNLRTTIICLILAMIAIRWSYGNSRRARPKLSIE